jgi:type I restriction enzyme, S subunit
MIKYRLGDIVDIISEREDNPSNCKYDKFVGLEHYVSGEVEIKNYGNTDLLKSAMKVFNAGDILVARRNVYLKRASVVNFEGITSGDSIVLRAKYELMKKLLPFILNTDNFWEYAEKFSDGTMSKRLSPKILLEYEFNLPDIKEQEKLAELLWAANDTKEAYKKLLSLTDDLVKSQFIEMFDNLFNESKKWLYEPLGDHADIFAGNPFKSNGYVQSGIKICGGLIIMPDRIAWEDAKHWPASEGLEKYLLHEEDIVLAMDRPWISGGFKIAVIKQFELPALLIQRTAGIRGKDLNQEYILWALKSDAFLKHCNITQTTVPHISMGDIKNFVIPIPPLDLQNQFAEFVRQSDKSKFELQQTILSLENTIKSLMQQNVG